MIIHGAHTACNGGRCGWPASKVGNVDFAVSTHGSGSQAGLADAYPEGRCVCLGGVCGDCLLGWDGGIIIFHLICFCPPIMILFMICIFCFKEIHPNVPYFNEYSFNLLGGAVTRVHFGTPGSFGPSLGSRTMREHFKTIYIDTSLEHPR